jgi:hypothetical protein
MVAAYFENITAALNTRYGKNEALLLCYSGSYLQYITK